MSRNAAGVYSLPNSPVAAGTTILAADENTTRNDMAAELTNSLDRNGRGAMLAPLQLFDGSQSLPGLTWGSDTNSGIWRSAADTFNFIAGAALIATVALAGFRAQFDPAVVGSPSLTFGNSSTGFYRSAADEIAITVAGTQRGRWNSTGLVITGALSSSGTLSGSNFSGSSSGTNSGDQTVTGTSNQISVTGGGGATPTVALSSTLVGPGTVRATTASFSTQVFTSGSGTYTTPAGVTRIRVRMLGSGAGGGGSGTGAPGSGSSGGDTTFSTFTAGKGGPGTSSTTTAQGGTGGVASGSPTVGITGNAGDNGSSTSSNNTTGGVGGAGPFGGAGVGGGNTVGNGAGGNAGANSGAGGGGGGPGSNTVPSGGGGGAGAYIEHWISAPAASYSYAVGAGGSGGGAGTSGAAGGNGGSGIIIVEEYYI